MRPPGFRKGRKYPVLLNIHGGPFTQYGNTFFDEFQMYTSARLRRPLLQPTGFVRLLRGVGQGDQRSDGSAEVGWGTVDYEDVMAVTDEALRRFPLLRPDAAWASWAARTAAIMTSWIVSHTNRFKAACSERAVNAWHSMHGSSDFGWPFARAVRDLRVRRPRRRVDPYVSDYLRDEDPDAPADPPFGERPALSDRAGRAAVHDRCGS